MKLFPTLYALLFTTALVAANQPNLKEHSASGIFASFKDDTLTIKAKSGIVSYRHVGANYKAFENNEDGPGARLVDAVEALGHVAPGTVVQVCVENREIIFGLDYRVIGGFESYQDGHLRLLPVEVPTGFINKPAGEVVLKVDPNIPVLVSTNGDRYQHVGRADEILKTVKHGTIVTARSEYDIGVIEVIQIGEPKQRIERYIGQSRGTVRGSLVSFKDGVLRIRGRGVTSLAANEYDRLIALRIADSIPIVESIDGGVYQPAGVDALKAAKEGAIVTVRKVEEVILEVQIGVAKTR